MGKSLEFKQGFFANSAQEGAYSAFVPDLRSPKFDWTPDSIAARPMRYTPVHALPQ